MMNKDFEKEFYGMQSQGWRRMPFEELFKNAELMQALAIQFRDTNDIEKTNTVIQLKAIGEKYKLLQHYIAKHGNADPISLKHEAETIGKQIINEINKIAYQPLKKMVADFLLDDATNEQLFSEEVVSILFGEKYEDADRADNYKRLKMYFNNYLNDNYKRTDNTTTTNGKEKKIPAKYYALYHLIVISIGRVKPFPKTERDKHPKSIIKNYAEKNYPMTNSEGFYNAFREIDYTNKKVIRNIYGKGYKEIILTIANNDYEVIKELEKFPS